MRINWKTIGATLFAGAGWLFTNVNWAAAPHNVAVVVGVVATAVAAFSKPAVERTAK